MKMQFLDGKNILIRTAALGLSVLAGGMSPQASALPDGATPKLTGLKIATPAGDAVEMSTENESLSSVALEVTIEADKQGVEYFELNFRSPDRTKVARYWGSGNWGPTKSNALLPRDETNVTFLLGAGRLSKFYDSRGVVRPLDEPGVWTLDSVYLYGRNRKGTFLSVSNGNLPTGLTNSFQVTRWFAKQPAFTSVFGGGTLTLAPGLNASAGSSPTYQWFRNGTAIPGATKLEYSKTNVTAADAGLYYLQVTSGSTKVRSDAVPVSIRSADVVAARSEINVQNSARAKQRAAAALRVSPDGGEALFVSALSELLGVLTDPLTKPLLAEMGATVTPKFPFADFNWTGTFPATADSAKLRTWLLSVFLPAVERADAALEKITDPRFVTWVSGADFNQWSASLGASEGNLLVDYGDIQGLRLGMNALCAFFRLWTSMDTSVRLDSLQALLPQGKLSVESILKEYPNLLGAAADGSANQNLSVDAMTRAATVYRKFSDFVLNPSVTPGMVTRYIDGDLNLFNVERQFAEDGIFGLENNEYVSDLFSNIAASAVGGTREFIADTEDGKGVLSRYPVNLKALKERPAGVRSANASQSFVPAFKGNLISGVVANSTLNGVLPILNGGSLAQRIAKAEPAITKALGTRDDQTAPSLELTVAPKTGSKVLLVGLNPTPIVFSGKVQDENGLNGVFLKLNSGGRSNLYSAKLTERQPTVVGGKTILNWDWTVELPDVSPSPMSYSIYAEDKFEQRSPAKTGNFGVVRAVMVTVPSGTLSGGTVSVVPRIPQNGLVEVGTRLRVSAVANTGSLFSKLQVSVGGATEETFRATRDVLVTNSPEINIRPFFVPNPFPALAGQWTGLLGTKGFANMTVSRTGSFTLRVVSGRNTSSYSGVLDASGNPRILNENLSVEINNGMLQLLQNGAPASLAKAATLESVRGLPQKRFNAALVGGSSVGYFTFDATAAGVVVSTGMVNLPGGIAEGPARPQKTVRYSFSTPLVTIASAPVSLGMRFYSVASPGDIGVNGDAGISVVGGTASLAGSVSFSSVPTRSPDAYEMQSVMLKGFGYRVPGNVDFTATAAARSSIGSVYGPAFTFGKVSFVNGKSPTYAYVATGQNPFVTNKTTLRVSSGNGLLTGNLVTFANGEQTTRPFSGVVLREAGSPADGPLAVGLSSDGLLISFAPFLP